jgi:predicted heme/steroid binding protein
MISFSPISINIQKYVLIISAVMIGYSWTAAAIFPSDSIQNSEHVKKVKSSLTTATSSSAKGIQRNDADDDKPDPPRNFTLEQLLQYDGTKDEKSNEDKPVYLSINGYVFDVTKGRNFYGPGGPYEKVSHGAILSSMFQYLLTLFNITHTLDFYVGNCMVMISLQVTNAALL